MKRFVLGVLVMSAFAAGGCAAPNGGTGVAEPVTVTVSVPVTVTVAGDTAGDPASTPSGVTGAPDSVGDTAIPGLESEGTNVDPCKLVTLTEAQKLAATKLNAAIESGQTCTYTAPVDGPTALVRVAVGPGAKKQLDIEKALGHKLRKLAGVGTQSWAADSSVYVSKGALWTSVELVRLNEPSENVKRLEQVAKTVASRL